MRSRGWRAALAVVLALALAGPVSIVGPVPAVQAGSTFVVDSTADEPDATPGDGVCASTPSGKCTLRAAIMEANALPGADSVVLPSGTYTTQIGGSTAYGEDAGAKGDLDITDDLTFRKRDAPVTA